GEPIRNLPAGIRTSFMPMALVNSFSWTVGDGIRSGSGILIGVPAGRFVILAASFFGGSSAAGFAFGSPGVGGSGLGILDADCWLPAFHGNGTWPLCTSQI